MSKNIPQKIFKLGISLVDPIFYHNDNKSESLIIILSIKSL